MARIETLTDNFNDNTQDVSLWATYAPAYSIAETGGQLIINLQSNNPVYDGYYSVNTYDLTGSQVTVRQIQGPSSLSGCQQMMFVQLDNSNKISIVIDGPNITFVLTAAGVDSIVTTARDDAAMSWWRIRESGGTIFWDTSSDGSSWANRRNSASTFSVTSVVAELAAGTWQNVASPGTAIFDNFNTLNTVPAGWFKT